MTRLLILFPLLLLLSLPSLNAQSSSTSKSKDRLREKDERRFPVSIKNMVGINSKHIEIGPAFYEGGIVFVSTQNEKGPRDTDDEPFQEYYYAVFDPNGDPSNGSPFQLDGSKKSPLQDGQICFSRDMKTAYFTRTNNKDGVRKSSKKGVSKLKIYETQKDPLDPDWSPAVELPFNSDEFNCVHPTLSPDGTKLFFASDMTGGAGGYDLYWVERFINQNGTSTWGKPNPLTAINTPKNDAYPFISYQGTLFFSSDGRHINSDRTDFNLYFVVDPFTNTTEVVDLNEPFNTTADDKNFVLDPDGKKGFFVSNRKPGYGKEDIFRFDAPRGLEGTGKKEVNPVKMVIRDAKSGDLIQNAAIRILQPTEDGFLGGNGNDDFYKIEIAPVQDQKNAVTFSLVRKDATDLGRPELFSNAAGEARTEFDRYRTYLVLVSLDGYRTIEKLHTVEDEKDLVFNFALKEAPLCFRTGGIVLSTEFGTRITNATVKLIHSESGEQISVRTTTNGEFDACLPTEGNYLGTVEREGFQSQSFRTTATRGSRTSSEILLRPLVQGASVEETMPLANGLQDGSIIIMERLFYEYNKATLNQYVVRNLEALYELMIQYPQMEVDILVHTDTRGDYQLNKELTDERAINVKKYLEYRGVESSRINAIGLGESKPRNKCLEGVECSDKEHQENNRLEIMVKKLGSARK